VRYFFLVVLLALCSCAPMPGNTLFKGLEHSTPIAEIESVNTQFGLWNATKNCNAISWNNGGKGQVVLNCILNNCLVYGCSLVKWNESGDIYQCDIYAAWDVEWIMKHEMRHCEGYDDVLY